MRVYIQKVVTVQKPDREITQGYFKLASLEVMTWGGNKKVVVGGKNSNNNNKIMQYDELRKRVFLWLNVCDWNVL